MPRLHIVSRVSFLLFFALAHISKTWGGVDASTEYLVRRAATGDEESFTALVEQHRERVYGIAWQLTHRREDALDVTQEAFVRMWYALESYRGQSRFTTWLHRIVLNTAIDYIRRESRHAHLPLDATPDADDHSSARHAAPEPSTAPTQRESVYEAQLQRKVLAALHKLSERQRQVFILRYYHGLSIRETAEIIHASEGTVKQHLSRAQLQLKELLGYLRDQ